MMAFRTWMLFAKKVYLFGEHEPVLSGSKVHFVPSEQFPRIKDMVILAASQKQEYSAICNGDILLDPQIMRIEQRMRFGNYRCASSRRWHFKSDAVSIEQARESSSLIDQDGRDDRGRDVFIARWDVWGRIAKDIPDQYRISHNAWDAYLTDKFREHWNDRFLDFTAFRYVLHPHHGGRKRPYHETMTV